MSLKEQLHSDMQDAMRARDKERLSVIRMLLASIQSREIEQRGKLSDSEVLAVTEKLIKQRQESAKQFAAAGRHEREQAELAEAEILRGYLPEPLSETELTLIVDNVVKSTGASVMKDMGIVMAALREQVQGRADMGKLSGLVRRKLAG